MAFQLVCSRCQQIYEPGSLLWRCPCGGLFDLATFPISFPRERINSRPPTLWRYLEALPFDPNYVGWQKVTMGEGYTPLVQLPIQQPGAWFKMDYSMPTLSFKDRGAAVLIAKAAELGVEHVIADSSGNAGTAIAAYAARAGITCDIYVPASASSKKLKQIAAHGASVHAIAGSREDTAAAAIAAVERGGVFYASHVYNPFFYQGTKTYAFEIWEQLGGHMPDSLILPVGNGTLVLGAYYGCQDLLRAGLIERLPRLLAVQAENCAPLAQAFEHNEADAAPVENKGTVAEGIAIAAPARSRQILAALRESHGAIITVSEAEIETARLGLARQGLYVEPTAAVPYAGYLCALNAPEGQNLANTSVAASYLNEMRQAIPQGQVVISLCGAGLKAA
ncbi:pyridoxal-phosphate dependent enzyme [Ktedonosporobacter rubrisoli]|uniref:Pyridoxal-phosphate dependent enzyme n=1 Tax=Ktedonosporobacter rubrisoli TaxID=2509675 RepID=A0A4P6JLQ3_KTERU|nr:threonine synthase [Ktedonosporobacter rubrisoli]QBD75922.1 pyridoxal-phosphate dependent enzyme [Ktedonosporobacter rubrisoli]